jgi:hypothetical protein
MFCRDLGWEAETPAFRKLDLNQYPLVNVYIAIENGHLYPFIVDFPIKHGDFP